MAGGETVLALSLFSVAWFHGVFTVLFAIALYLIGYKKRFNSGQRYRVGLALVFAMYTISTVHCGMAFAQNIIFLGSRSDPLDDNRARHWGRLFLIQTTVVTVNCLLADLLLIWRAWILYGRDYRVAVVPAICLLGLSISGLGYYIQAYQTIDQMTGSDLRTAYHWIRSGPRRNWGISMLVYTSVTNLSMTGIIGVKLVKHQRFMRRTFGYSKAWLETLVIIESGALYTLAFVSCLILFVTNQDAEIVVMDLASQLSGIVPTLIIVTISAGLSPVNIHPEQLYRHNSSHRNQHVVQPSLEPFKAIPTATMITSGSTASPTIIAVDSQVIEADVS